MRAVPFTALGTSITFQWPKTELQKFPQCHSLATHHLYSAAWKSWKNSFCPDASRVFWATSNCEAIVWYNEQTHLVEVEQCSNCAWTPASDWSLMVKSCLSMVMEAPSRRRSLLPQAKDIISLLQSYWCTIGHVLPSGLVVVARSMPCIDWFRLTRIYPGSGNGVTLVIPESHWGRINAKTGILLKRKK